MARPPQRRMAIYNWLREHRGLHSSREISEAVGYRIDNVRKCLQILIEQRLVVKAAYGKYAAL